MSTLASQLSAKLNQLADELDESSDVKIKPSSYAIIQLSDESSLRIDNDDCQRFFATEDTAERLCRLVPDLDEAFLELYDVVVAEKVLWMLEERFASIEEK